MMNGLENWAINAYADGELDPVERANVERMLNDEPEARRVLDGIQRQKAALKQAYDKTLGEPLPHSLAAQVNRRVTSRFWRFGPFAAVAASVAMLLLGGAGGYLIADQTGSILQADMARRAIVAHEVYSVEVKHPVEVAAADTEHLQKWLSKRLGAPLPIPDIADRGFTFLGGRLLASEDRPAAQLMYEDASKRRLTIYVTSNPSHGEESLRVREKDKIISCYWVDGDFAMAVTAADMPYDDMMKLAEHIYDLVEKAEG
jgi:anti-sigma factor RsiW